ncbi:kinase-like protein [Lentinus tigrinus ALCF2SS1-7]|uniref:kinase-like protein n=1 Tax=Lentinus tigrinus ALCF2SS1-7 TaxID=1328758 RepID=UPI0011662FC6|nr:kinase-like protein [Lentinus tigrinus ALCF2SS1-7]
MLATSSSSSLSCVHPAHSPLFGVFSPSSDSGDMSSDDGDSLHTPLTEHHDHRLHSCNVYEQHHFTQDIYHPIDTDHSEFYLHPEKTQYSSPTYRRLSPHHPSSASERSHDFSNRFSPSRENTHFPSPSYSSRALDPTASPFTPTRQTCQPNSPVFSASPFLHPDASPSGSKLSSLPSLTLSNIGCDDADDPPSLLLPPPHAHDDGPLFFQDDIAEDSALCEGRLYSARFHPDHLLNVHFVRHYLLEDELGAGGYGFVMTARHRTEGHEVAVKFIIKDKVPEHAWWDDEVYGRIPTEVMLLSLVNHENIVRCLDLFEDDVYFYLVQELHGTPWVSRKQKKGKATSAHGKRVAPPSETPNLTSSSSAGSSLDSAPHTPSESLTNIDELHIPIPFEKLADSLSEVHDDELLAPAPEAPPKFTRRPSHDLFECIEQSKHKRLTENQARYIFAQVVEAVYYLDAQGITHCDIKDENLVVDADLKVKLIDFGSAVVADPTRPRPFYNLFFGTTAYASSEILLKKKYQAPPAEIWTLGVLLSYLLTGHSPFPTEQDAKEGRVVIREPKSGRLSRSAISLMARCLEKEPEFRADIHEVRNHSWLRGALESRGRD